MEYELKYSYYMRYVKMFDKPIQPIFSRLFKLFGKQLKGSGPLWTIDRFKRFRNFVIQVFSGSLKDGEISTVRLRLIPDFPVNSSKNLKGVWGQLLGIARTNEYLFEQVIQGLSVYSLIVLRDLPQGDLEKFERAVASDNHIDSDVPMCPTHHRSVFKTDAKGKKKVVKRRLSPFRNFWKQVWFSVDTEPRLVKTKRPLETYSNVQFDSFRSIGRFVSDVMFERHMVTPWNEVPWDFINPVVDSFEGQDFDVLDSYGIVRYRLQPGGKTRFYLDAPKWMNNLFIPLSKMLYDVLLHAPWDCTYNQSKADSYIQGRIKSKQYVYCYDLSSATDMFPVNYSIEVIENFMSNLPYDKGSVYIPLLQKYLQLYLLCSTLPFDTAYGSSIQWTKGQPLGMQSSFAIFALSHGLLVLSCAASINMPVNKAIKSFHILGDDIVIYNKALAETYVSALAGLKVSISFDKSVVSNRVAEFAGKLYTANRIFYKPKYLPLANQFITGLYDTFGHRILRVLKPRQKLWLSLPFPIGRDDNGAGSSLALRYAVFNELTRQDKEEFRMEAYPFNRSVAERYSILLRLNELTSSEVCVTRSSKVEDKDVLHPKINQAMTNQEMKDLYPHLPVVTSSRQKSRFGVVKYQTSTANKYIKRVFSTLDTYRDL